MITILYRRRCGRNFQTLLFRISFHEPKEVDQTRFSATGGDSRTSGARLVALREIAVAHHRLGLTRLETFPAARNLSDQWGNLKYILIRTWPKQIRYLELVVASERCHQDLRVL